MRLLEQFHAKVVTRGARATHWQVICSRTVLLLALGMGRLKFVRPSLIAFVIDSPGVPRANLVSEGDYGESTD